jgi:hypothetical protein
MAKVSRPGRRRRGVTLIEAVLYISVALGLIVGSVILYQQAVRISQINYIARTYAAIIAEVRVLSEEATGQFIPNAHEILFLRGAIPTELYDKTKPVDQRLRFPFKDMWTAVDAGFLPNAGTSTALRIWNADISACSRLAVTTKTGRLIFSDGFSWGQVRETVGPGTTTFWTKGTEMTPALAGAACKAADGNGDGEVLLELSVRFN